MKVEQKDFKIKANAAIRRAANPFRKRARVHTDRKKEATRSACRNAIAY